MSLTIDDLVCLAVAAPHDKTRRKVVADWINDHLSDHEDGLVAAALRGDRRGPKVLRTVWQEAQDKNLEPSYKLLWAVVVFGLDQVKKAVVSPAPAPAPVSDPELDPVGPFPVAPYRVPPYPGDRPWDGSPSDARGGRDGRWVGTRWAKSGRSALVATEGDGAEPLATLDRW